MKIVLYAALAALILLHNDFWYWDDATRVLGLPIGFTYHILYCVAGSAMMTLLVKLAWPARLEEEEKEMDAAE